MENSSTAAPLQISFKDKVKLAYILQENSNKIQSI